MADPKLGFDFKASINSAHTSELVHAIPGYTKEGAYFYVAVEASQPEPLKAAFEEFLTTSLSFAKEMSPDIEGALGEARFEVVVSGNYVVIAVNLMASPVSSQLVELMELSTKTTVQNELTGALGIFFDKNFTEILSATPAELSSLKGNFHFNIISTVGDKYKIKKTFLDLADEEQKSKGGPADPDGDKIGKLIILMFHSFSFKFHSNALGSMIEAAKDQVEFAQTTVREALTAGQHMYKENKEMIDGFPFIQPFFDALEQYGSGKLEIGIAANTLSFTAVIYGNDFGQIYKQVTS